MEPTRPTPADHQVDQAASPPPHQPREELADEQRREADVLWAGPGVPAMTDAQWKGALGGALIGGLVGAVVLLPFGFIPWGMALGWRLLLMAIVGALAGGTAGTLYWGGRLPEVHGEMTDGDGRPSVGTTMRDDPRGGGHREHGRGAHA